MAHTKGKKKNSNANQQLRPLIEFGSCSSSTAGLAADQVGSSGLFFNLQKKRSFLKHLETKLILEGIQRQK
jgi:hypothetical protein